MKKKRNLLKVFLPFLQKDYYLVVANAYLAKKEPQSFIFHNAQL